MKHIVLTEFGTFLGISGERLIAYQDEKVIKEIALNRLSTITIVKNGVSFSSNLLLNCGARGIKFFIIDEFSHVVVSLSGGHQHAVVKVRNAQLDFIRSPSARELSKRLIVGKLKNQKAVLLYNRKYLMKKSEFDTYSKEVIDHIDSAINAISNIVINLKFLKIRDTDNWRAVILGYEGAGAGAYWNALSKVSHFPSSFKGRVGRGATDIVNQMLNYGYAILSTYIWHCAVNAGLEIYSGFLHTERAGKPSLILDLMEEYRPWIVDRSVIKIRNNINPHENFTKNLKNLLTLEIQKNLTKKIKFKGKNVSVESMIQRQLYRLCGEFFGESEYKPYIFKW